MFETIELYFENLFVLPKSDMLTHWEKVFLSMAVHTRKRVPVELLLARRPNEDLNIHQYRINNYRAITYGSMNQANDDLHRIVSGISYTVNVEDNVREYLNNGSVGQYCSTLQNETITPKLFIEKITLKRDIEDPNGFLIWYPTGGGVTDSSKKVVPQPKLIYSSQFTYADENVFIYLSEEKSPLRTTGGKSELKGEIYYFLTKNEIWKMYQIGTLSKPAWTQEMIYKHDLGAFPVIVLGGDINSEGYYESYFSPYLAFGDEAIHQFSDWQAIMTTSSFPHKEQFATECMVRRVTKDSNNPSDSEENYSGGGNGEIELVPYKVTPYGVTIRPVPIKNDALNEHLDASIPSVRFISPDIEVARYSGDSWEKLIKKAEEALNINMTLGMDQSGVAKQIDKESQYSMITKIGNNFFDNIYLNSLKIIDGYLNRKPFEKSTASINKPSSFWVKSESELVEEITSLKSSNAPRFFLQEATIDLATKRFSGNPLNEKIFKVIALYDPYYTHSESEKNSGISAGTITKEDVIRSQRIFNILKQIAEEKTAEVFMKMEPGKIYEEFETRVQEFFPEEPTIQVDDLGNPI